MKIRCKNCYRVLNNNEEYCTRCGEHSEEVAELLRTGKTLINPVKKFRRFLYLYLGIAFLFNAVLTVIFGALYLAKNSNIEIGEEGTPLPDAMILFSSLNALLITGIVLTIIIMIIEWKNIKAEIKNINVEKLIISLAVAPFVIGLFVFLTKMTNISFIPPLFKNYIVNPNKEFLTTESLGLIKIIPVMICYAFIEEYIFRKCLYESLDDATLLTTSQMVGIGTLSGTLLDFLSLGFFNSGNFLSVILILFTSFVMQYTMSIFYFINKKNITFNIIFRIVLYLIIILILIL